MGYIEYKVGGSGALNYVEFTSNSEQTPKVIAGSVVKKSPQTCGELEQLGPPPFMARIRAAGLTDTSHTIVSIYEDGARRAIAEAHGRDIAECTWAVTNS